MAAIVDEAFKARTQTKLDAAESDHDEMDVHENGADDSGSCDVVEDKNGKSFDNDDAVRPVRFYRAMHFSANARSWDRMSSVRPSVCL